MVRYRCKCPCSLYISLTPTELVWRSVDIHTQQLWCGHRAICIRAYACRLWSFSSTSVPCLECAGSGILASLARRIPQVPGPPAVSHSQPHSEEVVWAGVLPAYHVNWSGWAGCASPRHHCPDRALICLTVSVHCLAVISSWSWQLVCRVTAGVQVSIVTWHTGIRVQAVNFHGLMKLFLWSTNSSVNKT